MTLKLKYITHNHSACLLAFHFVTTTKKRRPELEGITLDLFRTALKKYPITIHVGEVMPDHIHLLVQAPATYGHAYPVSAPRCMALLRAIHFELRELRLCQLVHCFFSDTF